MNGIEGITIYRVGNPTLGAVGYSLTQAEYTTKFTPQDTAERLSITVKDGELYYQRNTWEGDASDVVFNLQPLRWYDRLWTALTRPRTLWSWLTPWR